MAAKVKVDTVSYLREDLMQILMSPVTSGPGNETWSRYTPSGKIELSITNKSLFGQFFPGDILIINFEKFVKENANV